MSGMHQIKASAGAGKTYTLTREFLKLLVKCSPGGVKQDACRARIREEQEAGPGEPDDWRGILAITFTNAAATEMQDRVLTVLKKIALSSGQKDGDPVTPEAARVWIDRILRDRDSLNISTIDSLLNLILRLCALPEGLPPDFAPVFNIEDILTPCLDTLMDQAWQGDAGLRKLIERAWNQLIIEDQQKGFLARGTIEKRLTNLMPLIFSGTLQDPRVKEDDGDGQGKALLITEPKDFEEAVSGYKQAIYTNAKQLLRLDAPPAPMNKTYTKGLRKAADAFLEEWKALGGENEPASPEDFAKIRIRAGDKRLGSKSLRYEEAKINKSATAGPADIELRDGLQRELSENTADFDLVDRLAGSTAVYGCFLDLAWRVYDLYKEAEKNGTVLNDSIPGRVRDILENGGVPEAVCRLGIRLRHFLIDEFQDTNDSQWQALRPLVIEALSEGGTLTWVGDVKQAIYGFRGGNSELFGRVARDPELLAPSGTPVLQNLPANYRSYKEIIAFNNAIFSALGKRENALEVLLSRFSGEGKENTQSFSCGEVPGLCDQPDGPAPAENLTDFFAARVADTYKDASQECTPDTKEGGSVHLVNYASRPKNSEIDAGEADPIEEGVVEALRTEREAGHGWEDMLVLVRTGKSAQSLARRLSAENIPVVTEDSLLVRDHPLIVQSEALLTFLLNPQNDTAFWTVVTGSIFSHCLSDGEGVSRRDLDDDIISLLANENSRHPRKQDDPRPPVPLYELWRAAHPRIFEEHIAPLLRSLPVMTVYDIICEWYRHEDVYSRFEESAPFLKRFLEIISACASQGVISLSDFLTQWKEHGGEEKVPMPEGMQAVSIMTVHKSKGLQAPVVIYPLLERRRPHRGKLGFIEYTDHLNRTFRGLGETGTRYPQGAYQALAMDGFETLNTFYVAFTRAEKDLWVLYSEKDSLLGPMMTAMLTSCAGAPGVPGIVTVNTTAEASGTEAGTEPDGTAGEAESGDGEDGSGERVMRGCMRDTPRWGWEQEEDGGPAYPDDPGYPDWRTVPDEDGYEMTVFDDEVPPEDAWPPEESPEGETAAPENEIPPLPEPFPEENGAEEKPWVPMSWVPKLHVHLDYMDESHPLNPAREQGIFIHSCLEELAKLPAAARDVDLVLSRNFRKKPWLNEVPYSPGRGAAPVPFRGQAEEEISWFLSLPGAGDWMDRGLAEQNLLRGGANPQMLRADLIVPDPDGALVIDYKHGSREVLSPEVERKYEAKMRLYLKSLGDTGLKRPLAVLCYLTRRECCVVNAAGATLKTDAQGLTAAIAAMRERANV